MADFAAPTGPPPPKLPAGWKAVWNDQYSEWFYVNIYTKKSQWDKPDEPVYPPGEGPGGVSTEPPPPTYDEGSAKPIAAEKTGLSSNNPYMASGAAGGQPSNDISEDEKLARQLQEEENAKAHTPSHDASRGAADSYYNAGGPAQGEYGYGQGQNVYGQQGYQQGYQQEQSSDKGKGKKGLLGKLLGKTGGSSKPHQGQQYQQQGYPPQQGYPQQYPQQGYGAPYGAPQGYYGGGYPQQQHQAYGKPGKKPGMGVGGAAALGVGGGLLGGMLLADAADAGDHGGDYGGDYGGDGGDFGGDGGDFGGGDFGGGF